MGNPPRGFPLWIMPVAFFLVIHAANLFKIPTHDLHARKYKAQLVTLGRPHLMTQRKASLLKKGAHLGLFRKVGGGAPDPIPPYRGPCLHVKGLGNFVQLSHKISLNLYDLV